MMSQQEQHLISYEELLRFYEAAGVDAPLDELPIDRFAQSATLKQIFKPAFEVPSHKTSPSNIPIKKPNAQAPSTIQMATSIELAKKANTLDELRDALLSFNGCTLKLTAKNTCFADGTAGSPLMLIGEAPGRDEDLQGIPFAGPSGQVLNKILAAIGLTREQVYIANTIPWRPPGNRTPTPLEVELCRPFIERQIVLSRPRILVALGGPATEVLTNTKNGIIRSRGKWLSHKMAGLPDIPVMPTFHPAYLLRTPSQKKLCWADFLEVKHQLTALNA